MGEKYSRKMKHGVMKAKGINVVETKVDITLSEINAESQTKSKTLLAAC